KNGISDFDPLTGGEAKVLRLEDFFLVKREKKTDVYSYTQNGQKKTLRLPSGFHGLAEFMEIYYMR
ncbi:MAG: hypothetical protein ACI4Q6_08455, partial [Huintestinicola sp.]